MGPQQSDSGNLSIVYDYWMLLLWIKFIWGFGDIWGIFIGHYELGKFVVCEGKV